MYGNNNNSNYRYNPAGYGQRNNGFQNQPQRNYGYQQNHGGNYNGFQSQQKKKKSGCKFVQVKDGPLVVSAWRVSQRQLFSLYARPYKNTKKVTSANGKEWLNYFVTIVNKTTMQETQTSGMFCPADKRLYIKDFNLICTSGGKGGYFGKHISK